MTPAGEGPAQNQPWRMPTWLRAAIGYGVGILVVGAALWLLAQAVFAVPLVLYSIVAALLLTALVAPLVDRLCGEGRWRGPVAFLTDLLVFAVVFGALVFVVRRGLQQVNNLGNAVDRALADLQGYLTSPPLSLSAGRVEEVRRSVVDAVRNLAPPPQAWATMALEVLSALAIVAFLLFFLLKDGPRMWRWAVNWAAPVRRPLVADLGERTWSTLTGYVRGMVVVATVDAVFIGLALWILGVPLALSLTLLVFLGAFVPIVGATVSGALAVLVTAVTVGTWQAVVVLGVVLVVQQLEGNVLQPLVMGQAVHLHPVVILLAVAVGGLLGGIGGAVIAVPVVAVGYRVLDRLVGPGSRRPPDEGSRSRADR